MVNWLELIEEKEDQILAEGEKAYYEPELLKEDIEAIFKILEKYGDDNDSIRGDLKVINQEENAEDIDSDFEHTSKEMADKLMEFNRDFSDDSETIAEEAEYLIGVFDKLKKSKDFNILAHHLDIMFMDGVFK